MRGKETARVLLDKLVTYQLDKIGERVAERDEFMGFIFLIRCLHEMDIPYDALLAKADEAFKKNGWIDTDELFGVRGDNLDAVKTDSWLILLMNVLMSAPRLRPSCCCSSLLGV